MNPISSVVSHPTRFAGQLSKTGNVRPLFGTKQVPLKVSSEKEPPAAPSDSQALKAIMLGYAIPVMTSFLWIGGPIPGILGAVISYFSGKAGRRLRIENEKLNQAAQATDDLLKLLQRKDGVQGSEIEAKLTVITGGIADLLRVNPEKLGFLGPIIQKGIGLAAKIGPLAWLVKNYKTIIKLDSKALQAAEATVAEKAAARILHHFGKGLSINMEVARHDNPIMAAISGMVGLFTFSIGWLGIPVGMAWDWLTSKFSSHNKPAPKTETPA